MMRPDLEDKLWKAGLGQRYDEDTWRVLIEGLLEDFGHFLSVDFEFPYINRYH